MAKRKPIRASENDPGSALPYAEPPAKLPEGALGAAMLASKALDSALWPMYILAYVAGCWALLLMPNLVHDNLPLIPWILTGPGVSTPSLLEILPNTRAQAWELGKVAGQLQSGTLSGEKAVERYVQILGLDADKAAALTPEALANLGTTLLELERPGGLWAKVRGLLNFANLLWGFGILGVLCTIGPAAFVLFGPLINWLVAVAKLTATWLHVLFSPFYAGITMSACFYITAAASRYPPTTAAFISLLGAGLAFLVTTQQVIPHLDHTPLEPQIFLIFHVFALAVLTPLALLHGSNLMGFLACAALFSALGFHVLPSGLHWSIGWSGKDTMLTTAVASAIILASTMAARALGIEPRMLAPFQLGLSTFGSITLALAGLIHSCRWYPAGAEYALGYGPFNALYLTCLLAATGAGAVLSNGAMFHTGATFMFLWLGEKAVELTINEFMWPLLLGLSGVMIFVANFLKTNPQWIMTMFKQ